MLNARRTISLFLTELWLRKIFPDIIYVNTNIPEKDFRVLRSQNEISKYPDDSDNIFKMTMLGKYLDRPDERFYNGRIAIQNKLCYSEFLRFYCITTSAKENNWQLFELKDEILEVNVSIIHPLVIPLMLGKEKIEM